MKSITYFYLAGCPYCRHADRAIEELTAENPEYGKVPVEKINEALHPMLVAKYDYYYVPTMFVDGTKAYEADPGQGYEEIKEKVREVFELALGT